MIGYEGSITERFSCSQVRMGRGSPLGKQLCKQIVQQLKNDIYQHAIADNLEMLYFTIYNINRFRESGRNLCKKASFTFNIECSVRRHSVKI